MVEQVCIDFLYCKYSIKYTSNKHKYETSSILAFDHRVLITKWVAEAVEHVTSSIQIDKYFYKTGCLMTVTSVYDSSILLLINMYV